MKVAAVQMDVFFGKVAANVARVSRHLTTLKGQRVDLAVFPEAALTGYCFNSKEDALAVALNRDESAEIKDLQDVCNSLDICAVIGFAEREGDKIFNSAVYFEPGQPPRFYRKTHLPCLGMDRYAETGDRIEVWDTRHGKLGLLICFDLRFPEAARTLALSGAELIVLPTNWPEGAEVSAEHIAITRAAENRVFVVTCNRVGSENGFRFIGKSKIIHPSGRVLAGAEALDVIIVAEIDLAEARQKRTINVPGVYETETFRPRRLDLYRS